MADDVDPNQMTFAGMPPRARTGDPYTSHLAAEAAAEGVTGKRLEVLLAYLTMGPMTDEQLWERLQATGHYHSQSGPRSRRAELVERNYVEKVGEVYNQAGNRVFVWDLSQEGRNWLEAEGYARG